MEFIVDGMVFLGCEERISQKTNQAYKVVSLLCSDGNVIRCMFDGGVIPKLNQLDKVNVLFKVIPGRYTKLKILDISKSEV